MSKSAETTSNTVGKYAKDRSGSGHSHGAQALAEIEAQVLLDAVAAILLAGDAILFGTTRDGGAVAIQAYSGDVIDKLYASTPSELEALLSGMAEAATG